MYDSISGELVDCGADFAVVEAGGIGYRITIPASTASALTGARHVRLLVSHRLRDERFYLYGFATREEREIFEKICTISGIGPGTALAILSGVPIEEFRAAVIRGQAAMLQRIKGVGKKTAERLVLELKEVLARGRGSTESAVFSDLAEDAISALVALGFTPHHAESVVRRVLMELPANTSLEDVIKAASRVGRQSGPTLSPS